MHKLRAVQTKHIPNMGPSKTKRSKPSSKHKSNARPIAGIHQAKADPSRTERKTSNKPSAATEAGQTKRKTSSKRKGNARPIARYTPSYG